MQTMMPTPPPTLLRQHRCPQCRLNAADPSAHHNAHHFPDCSAHNAAYNTTGQTANCNAHNAAYRFSDCSAHTAAYNAADRTANDDSNCAACSAAEYDAADQAANGDADRYAYHYADHTTYNGAHNIANNDSNGDAHFASYSAANNEADHVVYTTISTTNPYSDVSSTDNIPVSASDVASHSYRTSLSRN
jgi:hypothetical protein